MYEYTVIGEAGHDTLNVMGDVLAEDLTEPDKRYIDKCFNLFTIDLQKIDDIISSNLTSWNISRLSRVDLSIMRLALVEILDADDIPDKVSINEAVELAKKYSSEKAPKFINGVLAGCLKQIKAEKTEY